MEWQIVVALLVSIPVILLPVALVWYLAGGGIIAALKDRAKSSGVARDEAVEVKAE